MEAWFFTKEQRASYAFLLRWIVIAVIAGVSGASILAVFQWLVHSGQALLLQLSGAWGVPVPVFAVAAALVTGLLIYRVSPDAAGEGVPSYLSALTRHRAHFTIAATLMKFPAAVLTLAAFGSGGVVGPVGRVVSGALAALLGRHHNELIREERARTAAICGMAATVGALFHAPIGGGIFAVEVIQRANMRYRDLFPGVLSGAVAVWFSRAVGFEPLVQVGDVGGVLSLSVVAWTVGLAIVVGGLSGLFSKGYALTVRLFRRNQGRVPMKVVIGMAAASLLVWIVNPALFGTASAVTRSLAVGSVDLLRGGFAPQTSMAVVALVMLLARASGAYLTTGSGMSAGLTAPAVQIGMLAGVAAADVLAPLAGTGVTVPFIVVGLVGMLAGAMNVPVAAAILGVEVFGPTVAIPAAIAAVVAFQMNRHSTIYDYALAGSGSEPGLQPSAGPQQQ